MNTRRDPVVTNGGLRPGAWLHGKWRLERLLGKGGMSSVYLATHKNGSQVAIKVLHEEFSGNTKMQQRFLREGYIANRVGHPGAVRVLDDGNDYGRAFLVMDLLRGQDLEQLRRQRGGCLLPSEAVWIAEQTLGVLAAAHAVGIVHRDVKPQNLFLTTDGEVKLLDFGIASLRGVPGFTTLTDAAALPGTPGFMAPEQVRGRKDEVGPATDVWGVGATLFRLLTGQTVHLEDTAGEMMVATATRPARSLSSVRPEAPASLVRAVDGALRLEPGERFASAREMLAALAEAKGELPRASAPLSADPSALDEATQDADPSGASHQRPKREAVSERAPRRRAPSSTLALVLLAGVLLGAFVVLTQSWRSPKTDAPPSATESATQTTSPAEPALPSRGTSSGSTPTPMPAESNPATATGAVRHLGEAALRAPPPKRAGNGPKSVPAPTTGAVPPSAAPPGAAPPSAVPSSESDRDVLRRRY